MEVAVEEAVQIIQVYQLLAQAVSVVAEQEQALQ
jgi:hypothetical protein